MRTLQSIKLSLLPSALFFMLIITAGQVSAQYTSVNKKAVKWYRKAEAAYKNHDNDKALQLLFRATKKDSLFIEAWLLKADVLTTIGSNRKAIETYRQALNINSTFFPLAWLLMGNLMLNVDDYSQAVKSFRTLKNLPNISSTLKHKATQQLFLAETRKKLTEKPLKISISKPDTLINTIEDEYVNYISFDNKKLMFTRKIKLSNPNKAYDTYREQIFQSEKRGSKWQKPVDLNLQWDIGHNVGAMSITADGKDIYFTGCRWPDGFGRCDLYVSHQKNGNWQNPLNLGAEVNSAGWESQPFVSADGKYLLFSSTRNGGRGGSDIWMSVKLKNNRWSLPINMGDSINTAGNEMSPFLYADNKTLIFSSDGHAGMGKQDLFISRKNMAGIWTKAENLGYPVNTKNSEINFIYSLDGQNAWISSNRENNNYDIYEFPVYDKISPEKILFFRGKVIDAKTKQPLSAIITLTDVITGRKLSERHSISDDGIFLMVMEPRQTYAFNILAKGYLMFSDKFIPEKELSDSSIFTKTYQLKPIAHGSRFTLNNLYFEIDSPQLNARSFAELNKLVEFLNQNPSLNLEIRGHTDNTGSADYNFSLSQQRAKAVFDYLISNGISAKRLSYIGYGSTQPVADNRSEIGKAKNRRVEMVVGKF